MFCENCGSRLEEGSMFCTNCGQSIPVEPMPEPPLPVQQPARRPVRRTRSKKSFFEKVWENEQLKKSFLIAGCAIAAIALIVFLCCFAFADAPDKLLG